MPEAVVRGVRLNYATYGDRGPWVAFNPGSRRSHAELVPLADALAREGCRVLLHDRRNCGSSQVAIGGEGSEADVWADDLMALLQQVGAASAWLGGSSSGARLSLTAGLRHSARVRGLLLWRVTGGREAADRLARFYYGQYVPVAREGGMAAICATEHFAACVEARPENRERLMAMDPKDFIAVMERWSRDFMASADMPVVGAGEEQLRALDIPVILIPGNDRVHQPRYTYELKALMPDAELTELVRRFPEEALLDRFEPAEWEAKFPEMVALFADRIRRAERQAA